LQAGDLIVLGRRLLTAITLTIGLSGCGGSQVSTIPNSGKASHAVRAIAISPSGGLLADAVAVELSNRGFTVIDGADTSRMLARLNLNEIEIAQPEGLAKFRHQGIDALLSVRVAGGYDQNPQSATARVNSTHTGKVIAGVTWQNGWGGTTGSPADRIMRKGLVQAAQEITEGLVRNLQSE